MGMNRLSKKHAQRCANALGRTVYRASTWRGPIAVCWVGYDEKFDVNYKTGEVLRGPYSGTNGVGWFEGDEPPVTILPETATEESKS